MRSLDPEASRHGDAEPTGSTARGAPRKVDSRLAALIAAAASLPERAGSEFFVPVAASNARDVEPRVGRWLKASAQSEENRRAVLQYLSAQGQALGQGLRTVRLRDLGSLPSWAESLVDFLAAQPPLPGDAPRLGESTIAPASFERAARALLPRIDGRVEDVAVAEEAWRGIAGALAARLGEVCHLAIQFELLLPGAARDPAVETDGWNVDVTRAGWLDRLERLPGLAYVMGVACEQWRASVVETLRRLRADASALRLEPFGWDGADPLVEFKAAAGDVHGDGRSVTLLRFASGRGLVYKPKDLRHAEAMVDLVAFLNRAGLPLSLVTPVVLSRDGYGWVERVDAKPVADRSGFHRFYRRLGMLIRLVQLLNGRDLWADNLLAVGDQPVLVDLECLFCPPFVSPVELTPRRQALVERLETTVVRTAMPLQVSLPSSGHWTRDLGCLSHAGDPVEPGGDSLPLAPYRPWMRDEVADPWNHAEDVIAGYRDMHELLVVNRDALLLEDGALRGFIGARMRYIWRGTSECRRIVGASLSPTALVDGATREAVLAMVFRSLPAQTDRWRSIPEIVSAEIDSFRRLDVPLFTSRTTSLSLFTPGGKEIFSQFARTAWEEVRHRVASISVTPIDSDLAILRASIDAARGGSELALDLDGSSPAGASGRLRNPHFGDGAEPSADEVSEAVDDIAKLLLDARRPPLGTGSGWISLLWSPLSDLWDVGPAASDLTGGALGPALFLANHFSISGDPQSWTASVETLDELFEFASSPDNAIQDRRANPGALVPGGLAGPGALLYTAARVAVALNDRSLLGTVRTQVERAVACAQDPRAGVDLAFGLAGLLLQLLPLRAESRGADGELDSLASSLIARLSLAMSGSDAAYPSAPDPDRLKDLVPTGRDGVALALARAIDVAPHLVADRDSLRAAISHHRFDRARRGGRLAAMAVTGAAAFGAGPTGLSVFGTRALVLRAEEAQLAARCTGDTEAIAEAHRCIRILLDRKAATGRWFPDRLVDDRLNLSALDGVPALGSVLLRYLRPELPIISVLE